MENKKVKKIQNMFKVAEWVFIICASLSFWAAIRALLGLDEINLVDYVCSSVSNFILCLMLAFIASKTTVSKKDGNND